MTGNAVAVIGRQALAAVGDYQQAAEIVVMLERQLPLLPRLNAGCEFLGYDLAGKVDPGLARHALDALEPLLAPAPVAVVVAELVRLRLVTKARAEDPAVTDAAISVMAEDLSVWPLDVIRTACRSWSRNSTFWPSLAELNQDCEWRARRRLRMANALKRAERPAFVPTVKQIDSGDEPFGGPSAGRMDQGEAMAFRRSAGRPHPEERESWPNGLPIDDAA